MIGKFIHASYAVPLSQHYLDNLYFRLKSLDVYLSWAIKKLKFVAQEIQFKNKYSQKWL